MHLLKAGKSACYFQWKSATQSPKALQITNVSTSSIPALKIEFWNKFLSMRMRKVNELFRRRSSQFILEQIEKKRSKLLRKDFNPRRHSSTVHKPRIFVSLSHTCKHISQLLDLAIVFIFSLCATYWILPKKNSTPKKWQQLKMHRK